jgi:hypothetical protein
VPTRPRLARRRRTFVLSDVHGYPRLIRNALTHGHFDTALDRLVYAGDALDRGPDPKGCIDLLTGLQADVLFGNHEVAVLLGFRVFEQDPRSLHFGDFLRAKAFVPMPTARWRVAIGVDGVLITHAGLSAEYGRTITGANGTDPRLLAAAINREFVDAVTGTRAARHWDGEQGEERGVLGPDGPLWFRPDPRSARVPLPGLRQIAGHTPHEMVPVGPGGPLEEFHLTDPCTYLGLGDPHRYRYAVVEQGRVRMEDGTLADALDPGLPSREPAAA